MKDFLGKELAVGDNVVFIQLQYRNLLRGADKTVLIKHNKTNSYRTETKQFPNQVVKI